MLRWLNDHIPVFLISLTVLVLSWVPSDGVTAARVSGVMPWVAAFALEALLFFPQRRDGEDSMDARARVWHDLFRDPLFYVSLAFLTLLAIPIFNYGLCPACDYALIAGGQDPNPPLSFLPSCVNPKEHYAVFVWFYPAIVGMLAVKHGLSSAGKRDLVQFLVWNGALLAIFGLIEQSTGADLPWWGKLDRGESPTYFFSTFGYPNRGAIFFTILFALGMGFWMKRVEEEAARPAYNPADGKKRPYGSWFKAHIILIAAILNFYGAFYTKSRAGVMFCSLILLLWFVYALVAMIFRRASAKYIKMMGFVVGGLVLVLMSLTVFCPEGIAKELVGTDSKAIADRLTSRNEKHAELAWSLFLDKPVYGIGGWGYRHLSVMKAQDKDQDMETLNALACKGAANVHNDYLQFLCEHGIVGAGLLLTILIILFVPYFMKWNKSVQVSGFDVKAKKQNRFAVIYNVSPCVIAVLMATVAVGVHAFGDCPLRHPAVIALFLMMLASADGFFGLKAVASAPTEREHEHHHHHHHHHHSSGDDDGK